MQFKKPFLLFIASVVVLGILGFSIWYRWNTGQKLAQQRIPELTPSAEFNHGAPWIGDVAISPVNSDIIASVGPITSDTFTSNGEDGVIKAWNPRDNEGSSIKVWNRNNTKTPVLTLTDPRGKDDRSPRIIDYIAFSATGERLISRNTSTLVFWDAASGAKIDVFDIPSGTAALSPNGHLLATASNDIKLWDTSNLKEIKPIVVLPPKMGRQPLSHEEARSARHHNETIYERYKWVDFSSDGKWIAAGGSMDDADWQIRRGVVKIWDLQRRQLVKIFPRALAKDENYRNIRSISFSQDNRFFASVGSYGYTIWTLPEWHIHCDVRAQTAKEPIVFTLDDGTQIGTGVGQPVQFFNDLAFSPDGKIYAVAESETVTLYSTESVTPIALLKGGKFLKVVKFSQDSSILVSGGSNGIVQLWDVGGVNEK
jgi:WD40 repeat protein